MHYGKASKIATALATKKLPILPGDVLRFLTSGRVLFVVAVTRQEQQLEGTGQFICGLMSFNHQTHWSDFWIDWLGYDDLWFIDRLPL